MTEWELMQIRLARQHLTVKADRRTVARDLLGVQAQFMVNALHSLRIRCREMFSEEEAGEGLVKNWTVRGTVHVFDETDLGLFRHDPALYRSMNFRGYGFFDEKRLYWGLQKPYGDEIRRAWEKDGCAWTLTPERQRHWSEFLLRQVADGIEEREALKEACRNAGMTAAETDAMFDPWGGGMRDLCERGFLHYRVQEKKAFVLTPPFIPMATERAEREMLDRYLRRYAPAAVRDMAYFFGWPQGKVKQILSGLPAERTEIDGNVYFWLGELPDAPEVPPCILLAGFDALMLGYKKEESPFLPPEFLRGIFNRAGIVLPAILLNGRVAGRWKQKNGVFGAELFGGCTSREKNAVSAAAEQCFGSLRKMEWNG